MWFVWLMVIVGLQPTAHLVYAPFCAALFKIRGGKSPTIRIWATKTTHSQFSPQKKSSKYTLWDKKSGSPLYKPNISLWGDPKDMVLDGGVSVSFWNLPCPGRHACSCARTWSCASMGPGGNFRKSVTSGCPSPNLDLSRSGVLNDMIPPFNGGVNSPSF